MSPRPISTHPYWHVRNMVDSWPDRIERLNLSYYRYLPQTVEDPRIEFSVSCSRFCDAGEIQKIIDDTPEGHELAFHSRVQMAHGQIMHIPLIDMSTGSAAQLEKLKPFLREMFAQFRWYRSGRSFHGYASTVITVEAWAATMGILLLANQKGLPPTVDPRWIGHRLIAGYSALRWTKKTEHYIEEPRALNQGPRVGAPRGAV